MFFRFFTLGAQNRLFTFLLLTAVTGAAIMGLPKLKVDTGFSGLMAENDPDMPIYKQVVREFGSDNRIIVYVRDEQLWTPSKLAALESLHYALESLDFVRRVDDPVYPSQYPGDGGSYRFADDTGGSAAG